MNHRKQAQAARRRARVDWAKIVGPLMGRPWQHYAAPRHAPWKWLRRDVRAAERARYEGR